MVFAYIKKKVNYYGLFLLPYIMAELQSNPAVTPDQKKNCSKLSKNGDKSSTPATGTFLGLQPRARRVVREWEVISNCGIGTRGPLRPPHAGRVSAGGGAGGPGADPAPLLWGYYEAQLRPRPGSSVEPQSVRPSAGCRWKSERGKQ